MPDATLYPLRFEPVFRQYVWGGRRLGSVLGKPIGPQGPYAESWEVVDHGADQSRVKFGPLQGRTLHELVDEFGDALLGSRRSARRDRFPVLLKFLDADQNLSVQVHPNDEQAARLAPPDAGKTEAWYIVHADPGSRIYAGLRSGVDRRAFEDAISSDRVAETLHVVEPSPGDCLFIPAGTVHALGAGLLVAELQQSSDTTYRIYDWGRMGTDGKPRALHIDQALDVIDFDRGPIDPAPPRPAGGDGHQRLVQCHAFAWDRWRMQGTFQVGDGRSFHTLTCIDGKGTILGDPSGRAIARGDTVLIPAAWGAAQVEVQSETPMVLLDGFLPE